MKPRGKENTSNIVFHLAERMAEKGYTKQYMIDNAHVRFETVTKYMEGTTSRVDLYVLAALCRVLECNVQDIIEYVGPYK